MRIGIGEYYQPDPAGLSDRVIHDAQLAFVEKLEEVAPEIGQGLTTRVNALVEPTHDAVNKVVDEWSIEFNVRDDWILDTGVKFFHWGGRVVFDWYYRAFIHAIENGLLSASTQQSATPSTSEEFPSLRFQFGFPSLDLTTNTLDELEIGIRGQFERALTKHLNQIRRRASENAWQPTIAKRPRGQSNKQPSRLNEERHFEWLVRFQCHRLTYEQIARRGGVTKPAVGEAVRRLARLIQLTPRKPQRGRKVRR